VVLSRSVRRVPAAREGGGGGRSTHTLLGSLCCELCEPAETPPDSLFPATSLLRPTAAATLLLATAATARLAIGDLGTQYFADRGIFCAGRVQDEDVQRVAKATGVVFVGVGGWVWRRGGGARADDCVAYY
jgi:hypothetical protein